MISLLLAVAIQLTGVEGRDIRARAFFDACNVKVGDPMILTIDFFGNADFKDLHPPALSKVVDRRDWKLDDISAKTDTYRDARRLTYRVRPLHEGVLWFPALEFEYAGTDGSVRKVRANDIPVHAKAGTQVEIAGMGEDENEMPRPPELVREPPDGLDDDLAFAWRKACSKPSADAFAAFDFPEAKLNEASCAILDGNWSRAMDVYRRLEWRIGQTEAIERGIVAALALRYDNPRVELPVWRQVLRPLLRFGWLGRLGLVFGGFAALWLLFWLFGRGIRAVACLVICLGFAEAASGQDIFQQMEAQMQRMRQQMRQSFGGSFSMSFGGEEQEAVEVKVGVSTSRNDIRVGDAFQFIVSLEAPRTASIGQVRITPSEMFGLTVTGPVTNLTDGKSDNPTNVIHRLSVPARYDIPPKTRIGFTVEGMVTTRTTRNGGRFSFQSSNSFRAESAPFMLEIKPLPSAGQPADFSGIISEGLRIHETCDILNVETNDVVQITYRMFPNGYVPDGFLPKGAAFEWGRATRDGRISEIEYRRFFVADGTPVTPKTEVSYYDPRTRKYRTVATGGTKLNYVPSR